MSRYIDVSDLNIPSDENDYDELVAFADKVAEMITDAPSIDIVRCQDCKYWVYHFNGCSRNPCTEPWYATDGCTYGERSNE